MGSRQQQKLAGAIDVHEASVEPPARPGMRTLRRLAQSLGLAAGTPVHGGQHVSDSPSRNRKRPKKSDKLLP
jgi:hypothetical protein